MERIDKNKEMRTMDVPTIRPTDKGGTNKLEKIFSRVSGEELKGMDMKSIINETMKKVKVICNNRNNKTNRDGWSLVTRIISMRISVHGTSVKLSNRPDHDRIMKGRVEELRKREKKMLISEEEIGWMRDHGINNESIEWDERKKMWPAGLVKWSRMREPTFYVLWILVRAW